MNDNQFGFRPQKSIVDSAMAIKEFVQKSLEKGEVISLVNLDVQGVFDAAWWPWFLKELRECRCPKNLYELTKRYFTQRTAVLSTNSLRTEKAVNRGSPQGHVVDKGSGVYNSTRC